MHDILRERLIRKIENLPEQQVYQILDYIEFLEGKYGEDEAKETSGLRRFAEAVEDKMRKKAMSPATLREAFQLISAADKVLANVSSAGKKLMEELTPGGENAPAGDEARSLDDPSSEDGFARGQDDSSVDGFGQDGSGADESGEDEELLSQSPQNTGEGDPEGGSEA